MEGNEMGIFDKNNLPFIFLKMLFKYDCLPIFILGVFVVDVLELNYQMLDHAKVVTVEGHLVEADHSIQKINVMNVVIEDIMPEIVDVLRVDDAGKFNF